VSSKDIVYWDAGLPGFGVKVTPKGRKVFLVLYRLAGAGSRLRKYTIGPYGRVTLAMARAQAQKIFAARIDGRDPAEEKKQSRQRLVVDRVDDLVETFIRERVSHIRTATKVANQLRWDVADKILDHQSGTISGVAAVYQRHEFLAERQDALERWGAHVADLVRDANTAATM
jgi:hypothetical protein